MNLIRSMFRPKGVDMWSKPYANWAQAEQASYGFKAENILEKVVDAVRAVRDKKAPYERDSILFDKIQYSWPLLSTLQKIALENNNSLTIVDFGGSLGSTYFQNNAWLKNISIKWIIVEQSHFVEIGKKEFQNEVLRFEYSLKEALAYKPSTILFSSVLQYIENPIEIINEVIAYGIDNIIIDRTGICNTEDKDIIFVQTVPEQIYKASYPCWFFNERNLMSHFVPNYSLITDFPSYCDPSFHRDNITFAWKGFFFNKTNTI